VYPISYQAVGAEVPTADFEDKRRLFSKIAREWIGWRRGLQLLRHANTHKSDLLGVRFDHAPFTSALKSMKGVKERRTVKLVGVAKHISPHIQDFNFFLKIGTFCQDHCITLKDRPANALAEGQKVSPTCPFLDTF
jgi:hypothetical protein